MWCCTKAFDVLAVTGVDDRVRGVLARGISHLSDNILVINVTRRYVVDYVSRQCANSWYGDRTPMPVFIRCSKVSFEPCHS
jgi:hypothetical protein